MVRKETNFINRKQIIRDLSKRTGYCQTDLAPIVEELGNVLLDYMAGATKDNPCEIRLFTGLYLCSKVAPPTTIKNPLLGTVLDVGERILPYCKFSTDWKRRINGKGTLYEERSANKD